MCKSDKSKIRPVMRSQSMNRVFVVQLVLIVSFWRGISEDNRSAGSLRHLKAKYTPNLLINVCISLTFIS